VRASDSVDERSRPLGRAGGDRSSKWSVAVVWSTIQQVELLRMGKFDHEEFEIVDETGRPVGRATRAECHRNPALIHPAVHVFVWDSRGRLFLQRRALNKDIQPGRWDTSVGGHLRPGEPPEEGARRELREELGVDATLYFSHRYLWRSERETEWVTSFVTEHSGPFCLDPDEVAEGRFWDWGEILGAIGRGTFTPNFEHELSWLRRDPSGAIARLSAGRWTIPSA